MKKIRFDKLDLLFALLKFLAVCCFTVAASVAILVATEHRNDCSKKENSTGLKSDAQHQKDIRAAVLPNYRIVTGKELPLATSVTSVQEGTSINQLTASTIIGPDGNAYLILTKHGLVKVGQEATALTSVGTITGKVVALHPTEDLGLIRLDVPEGVTIPAVEIAPNGTKLIERQTLTVISGNNPKHPGKLVVQQKRLLGFAKYSNNKHESNIVLSPRVWSGASGSGIYQGNMLVATLWGSSNEANTCVATDYRFVRQLLNSVVK